MINLFNIPKPIIDTGKFSNLLHDKIATEFENNFAEYVGAKYAVAVNSATTAIQLVTHVYRHGTTFHIPSCIPPVVCNAIITGGAYIKFEDDIAWVGKEYFLHAGTHYNIIDSAHKVDRNQFSRYGNDDIAIFSMYPTKPCAGMDGGIIASNNKTKIDHLRTIAYNGMSQEDNNWERKQTMIGFKAYMNAAQAYVANESLKGLDEKKEKLREVAEKYNRAFGLENTSHHLYRITVKDNVHFINKAKREGITCGIHYAASHENHIFGSNETLDNSSRVARTTVSIPFHECLTKKEIETIINFVHGNS